jgi:predicted DNA-binding transcriptional regulator AlpA
MSDDTATTPTADVLRELRAIRALLAETRHPPGELLDRGELAALTALGGSTVDRLRAAGGFGPADVRVGGSVRWRRAEVLAWIAHPLPSGELMTRAAWVPFWADLQRRNAAKK